MHALAAAVLVGVLMGAPATAYAATDLDYTPVEPSTPTLAGSAVFAECLVDEPWIDYRVQVTDPGGEAFAGQALLVLGSGARSVTVPLGTLTDGTLSGRVPWPRAAFAAIEDPSVGVTIRVEPSEAPPLVLPLSAPDCVPAATPADASAQALAATGLSASVTPLGVAGAAILAVGAVLFAAFRRRREG